jgi:hypothetical protein
MCFFTKFYMGNSNLGSKTHMRPPGTVPFILKVTLNEFPTEKKCQKHFLLRGAYNRKLMKRDSSLRGKDSEY